jgi:hypothetical protein
VPSGRRAGTVRGAPFRNAHGAAGVSSGATRSRAGYNTPEQFATAIARLRADPDAFVLVRWLLLGKEDPIQELLDHEYKVVRGIGTPGKFGLRGLNLYARNDRPSSLPRTE